jgi:hypothetical protein
VFRAFVKMVFIINNIVIGCGTEEAMGGVIDFLEVFFVG